MERPDVERGEGSVYLHGVLLSPVGTVVSRLGLPAMGQEPDGASRNQRGIARAQCRARIWISMDASRCDNPDQWRKIHGRFVYGDGVCRSSVANGVRRVDGGADATALHDVRNRMSVGLL